MSPQHENPFWSRVRSLRPELRSHIHVHRHHYRGVRWYVLEDVAAHRHQRLNPAAWELVARMDGRRTLEEIWHQVAARLGDDAPAQGLAIALLARLHGNDMLRCELAPEAQQVLEHFFPPRPHPPLRRFANPFYVRIPLLDPERLLRRIAPYLRPLFGRVGLWLWLLIVSSGALLAAVHWRELASEDLARVLDPDRILILLLCYPLVKAFHELGHAVATHVWGGEVHELGVVLLVFVPVPYVDASTSATFQRKSQRMAVGAAGVMVELFLASCALLLWLSVEPGLVRSVAWIVMLIGGVSTLFINGNPLLRFDGYYVLADALEIPNLAPRARRYLVYLFEHYILGLPERRSDGPASGERAWLIGYGIASFAYRMVVLLAIAIFVSDRFFLAGALLLLTVLALQLVLPIWRGIQRLKRDPRVRERPARLLAASAALLGLALAGLFVPAPTWTRSEGVVWLPERAQVRARADGFVRRILVAPGTRVEVEAPLVETEDPLQTARLRVLEARLRELRARYHSQRREDRVEAEILVEAIESAKAELAEARARADEGLIVAGGAGRLVLPAAEDLPGRFLHRGDVLGYVADLSTPIVRTVVSQNDVIRVRSATRGVEVRLAEGIVLPAAIEREVPAADSRLPSTALGSAGGGRLAIDTRDADGLTVTEPVFQLDLALPPDAPVSGIGARVHVRFEHPPEPLAAQLVRALRRLFLGRLDA